MQLLHVGGCVEQPAPVVRLFPTAEECLSIFFCLKLPTGAGLHAYVHSLFTQAHTHTHNIYMLTDNTIAKTARFSTFCDTNTATSIIPTHCRKVGEIDTYCDLTVQFLIRIHGMGMGSVTVVVTLLVGTTQLPENVCTYD